VAEETLVKHLAEWRRTMTKSFSPSDMLQHEHTRVMLESRRNERAQELRQTSAEATRAYAEFQVARQKNDVVERFHERQKREFTLSVLKEEQHLLDELASSRREPALFEKGFAHA
jgi:flagellar biosynthesis chaperone FliJ